MNSATHWSEQFRKEGFAIICGVLDVAPVTELIWATDQMVEEAGRKRGGVRNLLGISEEVRKLANCLGILDIANSVLNEGAFPVRGIRFEKTEGANWKVPWHQDLTIAVVERVEIDGFGPWSRKVGVSHVQPPVSILERIVSIRIHLDACPVENGALRVVRGSPTAGRLSEQDAARVGETGSIAVCPVEAGDVVDDVSAYRPCILCVSEAATSKKCFTLTSQIQAAGRSALGGSGKSLSTSGAWGGGNLTLPLSSWLRHIQQQAQSTVILLTERGTLRRYRISRSDEKGDANPFGSAGPPAGDRTGLGCARLRERSSDGCLVSNGNGNHGCGLPDGKEPFDSRLLPGLL